MIKHNVIKKFQLLLFLILLPVLSFSFLLSTSFTTAATTVTFGTTTVGSSTDTGDGNSITCNKYLSSSAGTLTSLSVSVGAIDTASKNYSLAIYADANGSPTTRLGSATGTLTANAWNTVAINTPIAANTNYWLCYNASTTKSTYSNMKHTSGSVPAVYKAQSYGTWPATFGTVGASWSDKYSIYASVNVDTNPTATPVPTSTPTPSPTPTAIPTPTPTNVPTATPTPLPTSTPTPTPTIAPTATPLPTSTPTPTNVPTPTPSTPSVPFTFGTTTVGSSTDTGDGNSMTCNKYLSPMTGILSSLSVAVGAVDSASKNYSLALYADTNGSPTNKLVSTNGTLTANAWNTVAASTLVAANTNYWVCYNTSTSNSAYNNMKHASGSVPAVYKSQTYGTWPATFGTVGASWSDKYSLYASANTSGTTPTPTPTTQPTTVPTASPTPGATSTPTPVPTGGTLSGLLIGMGDSYTSAYGAPPYVSPNEPCYHSQSTSYTHTAKNLAGSGVTMKNIGCSGADTEDVQITYGGESAQVGRLTGAKWVAMTIGGNDYDFLGAITQGTTGPNRVISNANNIKNNVITVINKVKTNVPGVKVYIFGYADILPTDQATLSQSTCFGSQASSVNLSASHNMYVVLNQAIKDAATATGATYIDAPAAFVGHDMCQPTGTNWIARLNQDGDMHPNVAGHQAMGNLLYQTILATQ